MGWKDGTPNNSQAVAPTAPAASTDAPAAPAAPAAGWRSGQSNGSSGAAPPAVAPADTGWSLAHNPILSVRGPWDAPANQPLGQTPAWNKPSDVSWSDYAAAHFQPIDDIVRESTNPFGVGDRFAAGMENLTGIGKPGAADVTKQLVTGQPADALSIERAKTAEAEARMPTQNRLAANVLGYAPVAELGVGTKLADLWGGSRLARAGGSAVENAVANVGGTAGRGDTNVGDLIKSGLTGLVTGGVTGGVSPSPKVGTTSPTTADLNAAKKAAFDPLETVHFNPSDIQPGFDGVTPSLGSGARVARSTDLKAAVNDVSQEIADQVKAGGTITADDIAKFQRTVQGAATNPQDALIAKQYADALTSSLQKARPLTTGSLPQGTNVAQAVSNANTAANKAKTSGEIDDWITQAQRSPGKVPDAVNKAITDDPQFYQTHPDLIPMLQDVANSKPGIWSKIGEKTIATAGGAAIEGISNYLTGSNPLSGALTGGATGLLLGHAVGKQRSTDLANKLAAARHLNATGMKLSPSAFGFGPLSKFAGYGQELAPAVPAIGASGWFANQPQ